MNSRYGSYMRIKKITAAVTALIMLASGVSSCNYEETTPYQQVYDYTAVTELIKTYEDSYREFVKNGEGQVAVVTAEGETPLGAPCSSRYTRSSDGAFESCSLEVTRDIEQHDEYFNISDGLMMFVRSYIDEGIPVIDKYISTGTEVYYVNTETSTMDEVTDVTALDIFVTFDQVRRVYGEDTDTQSADLSA